LNAPLEPRSAAGKLLAGVLLDDRDNFKAIARRELERISFERDEALARSRMNLDSVLHRRIAEIKARECGLEIEDIIYASILHNFMEMSVYLVPPLSQCLCNNRLEIYPRKDCELESIHSHDALEMVKDHINSIIGNRANSNVTQSWATTLMPLPHLRNLYNSSIFYGYFLKSASFRHALETTKEEEEEEGGMLGKVEMMRVAKPSSDEGVNVISRHCCALFGDECGFVCVSLGSVKRLVLEAVGFGSFLWDAE
ncbi:hypothetical protein M569_02093, partial [Genlisea aurea]